MSDARAKISNEKWCSDSKMNYSSGRAQGIGPQNMTPWDTDYFKLKEIENHSSLSDPPFSLKQFLSSQCNVLTFP